MPHNGIVNHRQQSLEQARSSRFVHIETIHELYEILSMYVDQSNVEVLPRN